MPRDWLQSDRVTTAWTRWSSAIASLSTVIAAWFRQNGVAFAIVFGVVLVVYSALATGIVLTNHTIPNAFTQPYPSYKSWYEGRWFADLLIDLQGGGSQSFQAIAGFAIQAINGLLFADLFGIEKRAQRIAVALLIALHPALLDYFVFTSDNSTFTFGGTLVLLGAIALDRLPPRPSGIVLASVLFALALATYQPTAAIVAVVLVGWSLRSLDQDIRAFLFKVALPAAASFLLSVLIYWASEKMAIGAAVSLRTHQNTPAEMISAALDSYGRTAFYFRAVASNLPFVAPAGPWLVLAAGAAAALSTAARRSIGTLVLLAILLLTLPPAMRISYLINIHSWEGAGRINAAQAYALATFAALALNSGLRRIALVGIGCVLYGFAVIAVEQNSSMQMKSLFEAQAINRVVDRLEQILPDRQVHPLVVVGELPFADEKRLIRFPNRPFQSQAATPPFEDYRQVDWVNFYVSQDLFASPTQTQIDAVLADEKQRPLWPQTGSVYMLGDTAVVLFQHSSPGVHVTWPG